MRSLKRADYENPLIIFSYSDSRVENHRRWARQMSEIGFQIRCNWLLVMTAEASRLSDGVGKMCFERRQNVCAIKREKKNKGKDKHQDLKPLEGKLSRKLF